MHFHPWDYAFSPFRIRGFHELLAEAQHWPSAKRAAWVKERLDRILFHAVRHVPYYRRTLAPFGARFGEMIDRLDLSELPVITKDTVKNHYDELCAESV